MIVTMPTKHELLSRIEKLYNNVNSQDNNWDIVFVIDKVNQYYLTGTIQDGVFVLKKDGTYAYFVRRSFERAKTECPLENVYSMVSYKDVANIIGSDAQNVYIETEVMTYGMLERLKKYFKIDKIKSIDKIIFRVRAVKSPYELSYIEESGKQHQYLLETIAPSLLKEGMNEAELTAALYHEMIKLGYHGVSRFAMFQTEMVVGQIGFGQNSLYPTNFDGPGGMKGQYPAVPIVGDRTRLLKKGDLVFIDIGYGVNGYHTDRTQIYIFGANLPDDVEKIHGQCVQIQNKISGLLKIGNIPSEIYNSVINELDTDFIQNFMGFGNRKAKFLGHGVGLHIDEYPVIAEGFNEPLEENMVIAVEPKKGIENIGVVGVEDTYIVTKNGSRCITGGEKGIIVV